MIKTQVGQFGNDIQIALGHLALMAGQTVLSRAHWFELAETQLGSQMPVRFSANDSRQQREAMGLVSKCREHRLCSFQIGPWSCPQCLPSPSLHSHLPAQFLAFLRLIRVRALKQFSVAETCFNFVLY